MTKELHLRALLVQKIISEIGVGEWIERPGREVGFAPTLDRGDWTLITNRTGGPLTLKKSEDIVAEFSREEADRIFAAHQNAAGAQCARLIAEYLSDGVERVPR